MYGIPEKITKKSDYTFRVILPEIPDRANSKEITIQDADYLLRVILPEIPDRANSKEITIQDADYLLLK
jgi:hypothetical protein